MVSIILWRGRGHLRRNLTMRRLRAHLIAALGAMFADILVGLPAPYTGPQAWMGEGIEAD
jgi:hypothetical protein